MNWFKDQAKLLPALTVVGVAGVVLADSHFDERYVSAEDGNELIEDVAVIQKSVTDVQTTQAVNAEKIDNIEANVEELKKQSEAIESKIDRLIERN